MNICTIIAQASDIESIFDVRSSVIDNHPSREEM